MAVGAKQQFIVEGDLPSHIRAKAFIRNDLYGTYALNKWSLLTKIRLVLVGLTLAPLKLLGCLACVVACYLCCTVGNAVLSGTFKTQYMVYWGKVWTHGILLSLGFSVKWVYVASDGSRSDKPPADGSRQRFGGYVSNHCSWVDIILFMSRLFPSFVAKKDVSKLPLIGPISKAMQCLFVDREARLAGGEGGEAASGQGTAQLVGERMARRYADPTHSELPMLLFPEGTTTNNRYIMPFKRGAFVAGVPVQPLVLQYDTSGRFSPTWDAMPGHLHILLALTEVSYRVTCLVLPVYEPSEEEKADPALYAENVRQLLVKYSKIPGCEETYADKLAFFKWVRERAAARRRATQVGSGSAGAAEQRTNGAAHAMAEVKEAGKAAAAGEGARQRKGEVGKREEGAGGKVTVHAKAA